MMRRKSVSIIIPTLNEEKALGRTLAGIGSCEVIVVDGGSTDKTVQIARKNGACVILARGKNLAESRNIGSAKAHGDILVQLDADTLINDGIVTEIVKAFEDRRVAGGTCKLYPYDGTWLHKLYSALVDSVLALSSMVPLRVKSRLSGSIVFIRRRVFERIGGYWNNPVADDQYIGKLVAAAVKFVFINKTVYTSARRFVRWGFWKTIGIHYVNMLLCLLSNRTSLNTWERVG